MSPNWVVLTLIGTRPEAVKMAPVVQSLRARPARFQTVVALTGQHTELLESFVSFFDLRPDVRIPPPPRGEGRLAPVSDLLRALTPVLDELSPDLVLVQGDTSSALAGALAAVQSGIPVGHVEAGLRSGDPRHPFPEEMNRRLIGRFADLHFAPTLGNRNALIREGVPKERIAITGNPVVDSLEKLLERQATRPRGAAAVPGRRRIVLTTHRRESIGPVMVSLLRTLRAFVERHADVELVFPVHPNPRVGEIARQTLAGSDRIELLPPLDYTSFIRLLRDAWLIVSDSGGIQEEAPTLGKPLLILRRTTERPEAVESGCARLVGLDGALLREQLEEAYRPGSWASRVEQSGNPFGDGHSGERIAEAAARFLGGGRS